MECDYMHSAMEYPKRKTNIHMYMFRVSGIPIASMARIGKPYTVIPVRHPDIVDFKKVHKDHYRNVTCDIKNNKIIWNKVKDIQLRKEKPGSMFV